MPYIPSLHLAYLFSCLVCNLTITGTFKNAFFVCLYSTLMCNCFHVSETTVGSVALLAPRLDLVLLTDKVSFTLPRVF